MTQIAEQPTTSRGAIRTVDAVVVGAGFAGLYSLHKLREQGLSVQVFEQGDGPGGTWYWNRYPGARVDVLSHNYSYSFSKELEQDWEWSERYCTQPELLRYVNHVVDRFDLRKDIAFNTRVESAIYDEATKRWAVVTDKGGLLSAQYVIMAVGCLSNAKRPEIPGLQDFQGTSYHTGAWPHEGVDLSGKRVGVIGTGSSGIQAIPAIAEQAAHVTVFQRTPNFSMPANNAPVDPDYIASIKARYPEHRQEARESAIGVPVAMPDTSALAADPQEREQKYQGLWDQGDLVGTLLAYEDIMTDKEANDTAAEFVRSKIREIVKDPEIAETLCPTDHPFGTKRPCLDSGYYATYNLEHVELVNLKKTPIVEITPKGVRTSEAEYEVDCLVLATGFDAMTGPLTALDIRGRGGLALREKWAEGPRTYLGLQIAGFPNLFTITGPGSPSVLSNMMVSIEQHVEWIADCIAALRERGAAAIEATVEAEDEWMEHVQEVGAGTLYPQANSWYMGANVPGKPRVFMPYAGGVGPYREKCDEVVAKGYEGFHLIPA